MEKPLTDKIYLLEKFPGKGGWTYIDIPEILPDKTSPFGWVTVKGYIDDFEIRHCRLMPMGNGKLFLPVKAEIRKKIRKKEGDQVRVVLFSETAPLIIPTELLDCLKDEPAAYHTFLSFTEAEKKAYTNWIYSAKKEETKIERIIKTIDRLLKGQTLS